MTNWTRPTPTRTRTGGQKLWNCRSAKATGSTVPRIEPMVGMKFRKKIVVARKPAYSTPTATSTA